MDLNVISSYIHGAVPNMMVARFNDTLMEFLVNLRNTFPDYELRFTTAMNELQLSQTLGHSDIAIRMFADVLGVLGPEGVDACARKDDKFLFRVFGEIGFLKEFKVHEIWSECPVEVQDTIWLYLIELTSLVHTFTKAGSVSKQDVMAKLQVLDQQVEGMLKKGMDPSEVLSAMLSAKTAGKTTLSTGALAKK